MQIHSIIQVLRGLFYVMLTNLCDDVAQTVTFISTKSWNELYKNWADKDTQNTFLILGKSQLTLPSC